MNHDNKKSRKVIPIQPQENRYHRVRITADPSQPRSIEIVEALLSRSEMARCEVATEEGVTTWSVIITEDLLDLALEGMAVTVPVEGDLFETDEGHICFVTSQEWFRLGGVAEDIARCQEPDDPEDFQTEVEHEIRGVIRSVIDGAPWSAADLEDDLPSKVECEVFEEIDLLTASNEDIEDAVQTALDKVSRSCGEQEE